MREIYVVTHPEATHHVEHLVGGWYNSELTPTGSRVAGAIGQTLRNAIPEGVAVEVYSSDLARARQTAAAICSVLQVPPVFDRRLREKSYGDAEGRHRDWFEQRFVPPPAVGERMNCDDGITGAESKGEFARRIYSATDDVLASDCRHQVIVTHVYSLTFIVASWIKMPLEDAGYVNFRVDPGSITVLREDDVFHNRQVAALGDTNLLFV